MEVELNPRKRKQQPNAISSTFTRSKSLVYSHLNRSGRFRRDPSTSSVTYSGSYWQRRGGERGQNVQNGACFTVEKKLKSSCPGGGGDVEVKPASNVIKDLRTRRVFSRPFVVGEQEPKRPVLSEGVVRLDSEMSCTSTGEHKTANLGADCGVAADRKNSYASKSVDMRSLEEDVEIRACDGMEVKLGFQKDEGSRPDCQGLGDLSPAVSNEKGGSCLSNLNTVNNLECDQIINDENVQTTPPDPDIIAQKKCNVSTSEQDVLQANDGSPRMPSICRKNDSVSRRKLVLNPCARLKVFRAPSSVSYRRLLPYLMDIAKDKSSALEIKSQVPLTKDSVRVTPDFEGETAALVSHTASKEKIESDGCEVAKETSPSDSVNQMPANTGQIEVLSPSDSPQGDSSCVNQGSPPKSRDIEMVLNPCARLKVFKDPSSVSYRRLLPYLMDVAKDKSCALEIKSGPKIEIVLDEKPVLKPQVPLTKDSLTVSDVEDETDSDGSDVAKEVQPADSVNPDSQNEVPSPSNSPKSVETSMVLDDISPIDETSKALQCFVDQDCKEEANGVSFYQSSSPIKTVPTSKGILRRNPRGCRGLCTCLNCSSFRLHAERAFEFSKNQMQDTEEIILQLTDELSRLRNVLEKSLEDSNDQAGINVIQVKEVCAKASKAEETARIRVNEMNEDLFIHCRTKPLQRPRVNFAIDSEENVPNDASPPNK